MTREAEPMGGGGLDRGPLLDDVRRLSRVDGWRSARAIVADWAVIAAAAAAAIASSHWAVYLLAILVIGTRQHAFAVLMHDGAHYRLFADRRVNDFVSDVFLAFPIGVSTEAYRRTHLAHHRYLNTEDDPDYAFAQRNPELWDWPKPRRRALRIFLGDLLGVNALFAAKLQQRWAWIHRLRPGTPNSFSRAEYARLVGCGAVALTAVAATGWWWQALVLWGVPAATVLPAISRLRAISEHLATRGDAELEATREIVAGPLERFLLAPHAVHWHLSHHLFPSVPFHALPALHERLMGEERFRSGAHLTHGYLAPARGVLAELVTAR